MEIHISPFVVVDVFYPYKYGYRCTHHPPPTPHWVYTDTLKILVIRVTCHAVPSLYSFLEVLLSPWQDWQVFSECYVWIVLWGNFFPCLILVKNILSVSGCPLQFASIWFPKGFNTFTFMSILCWDFVDFLFFQLSSLAPPPPPQLHTEYRARQMKEDTFKCIRGTSTFPPSFNIILKISKSEIFQLWPVICECFLFLKSSCLSFQGFWLLTALRKIKEVLICLCKVWHFSLSGAIFMMKPATPFQRSGCFICQTQATAICVTGMLGD